MRGVSITIGFVLAAGLAVFVLAPIYTMPIGAPAIFEGKAALPTMNASPSYYYLGFGAVSINLCGHQAYLFQWNRGLNVSCVT